jgi:RNA polymerase sigma-70 factor (ECF subfamily)
VERLRRQEAGAAEALVAAYGNRVYRLAIRITGNSSDAEEVVQDALWAATRKIDTFLGTAAVPVLDLSASPRTRPFRSGGGGGSSEPRWHGTTSAPRSTSWGSTYSRHRLVAETEGPRASGRAAHGAQRGHRGAAGGVSRGPALARRRGTLEPRISEALQIKLGTIKSRVHRARLFLRSRLASYMETTAEPR